MSPKSNKRKPTPNRKSSWEAKELGDIRRNWRPGWLSSEGKRRSDRRKT